MKRFHVHIHVEDLQASINFYQRLFAGAADPIEATTPSGCWRTPGSTLPFPPVAASPGYYLGFQTDTTEELAELKAQAQGAEMALLDEGETTCCYAKSEKHWITDPQGIAWEHFHTLGNIPVFNEGEMLTAPGACCAPWRQRRLWPNRAVAPLRPMRKAAAVAAAPVILLLKD